MLPEFIAHSESEGSYVFIIPKKVSVIISSTTASPTFYYILLEFWTKYVRPSHFIL